MSSGENHSLWQSTLENIKLPEEEHSEVPKSFLCILLDWSILHRIYNHRGATVARYKMITTLKSTLSNINYSSRDFHNHIGPTLGFSTLEESISAAVTITNRISNINQQYSIPLPVILIYLYQKDNDNTKETITEELKTKLIRSVRSAGPDIPIIGKLDYVQDVRKGVCGIFQLNIDGGTFAHVQSERTIARTRFRPKEQVVYDGIHYVLLSNKTEHSKANMTVVGALAVHDYNEDIEISPWESEENLRTYLSNVQEGTYIVMLLTDLYSYETSKGIVYSSKFLPILYSTYRRVYRENQKCVFVESFTLPYLAMEGEPTPYTIDNVDLVYFLYGTMGNTVIKADVIPNQSINSNVQTVNGKEITFHSPVELPVSFNSGLAELLSEIEKLKVKVDSIATVINSSSSFSSISSTVSSSSASSSSSCPASSLSSCTIPYDVCPPGLSELNRNIILQYCNGVDLNDSSVYCPQSVVPDKCLTGDYCTGHVDDSSCMDIPTEFSVGFSMVCPPGSESKNTRDFMKLFIPQPKSEQQNQADIDAVNIFEKILEANSHSTGSIRGGVFLPTILGKPFGPIPSTHSSSSVIVEKEPDIVAVTQEVHIHPITEITTSPTPVAPVAPISPVVSTPASSIAPIAPVVPTTTQNLQQVD